MRFSCGQKLLEARWISADSLDIAFNAHVRLKLIAGIISLQSFWQKWNFILVDKIFCKHYPKWNAYVCPSKYWVVLKCSRNERSCEHVILIFLFFYHVLEFSFFITIFYVMLQHQCCMLYSLFCRPYSCFRKYACVCCTDW